jgi:hypothetical protein
VIASERARVELIGVVRRTVKHNDVFRRAGRTLIDVGEIRQLRRFDSWSQRTCGTIKCGPRR